MAARVRKALAGPLPAAVGRMRLYLANPATHAILFKPIKSNIAEAHGQARRSCAWSLSCSYGSAHATANHLYSPT